MASALSFDSQRQPAAVCHTVPMPTVAGQNGRRLTLAGNPESEFTATLELECGSVTRAVHEHGNGIEAFFADLVGSWKGWSGQKTYRSLEGEMWLSASHDGIGTVDLTVRLAQPWPPEWSTTALLDLGAGADLDAISKDISDWSCC